MNKILTNLWLIELPRMVLVIFVVLNIIAMLMLDLHLLIFTLISILSVQPGSFAFS